MEELEDIQNSDFNIKEEVEKYLNHWIWFVLGVLIFVISAHLYIRYTVPMYNANASLLVKDDKKGGIASELGAFSDIGMLSAMKSNVDNEIEILKSRTLAKSTVEDLKLSISYTTIGRIKSEELYKTSPITFVLLNVTDDFKNTTNRFTVEIIDSNSFSFFDKNESKVGDFKFGEPFTINANKFAILKNEKHFKNSKRVGINYVPVAYLAASFRSRLQVNSLSKNTSVIELSLNDAVKEKAEDFLNKLVENYNNDAITDKQFIAENTSKFIKQRLNLISEELKDVETDVEQFKRNNQVIDIASETGIFLENASDFEKKYIENATKTQIVKTVLEYVRSNENDLIPANILPSEEGASSLIAEYNQLVLKRTKDLKSAGVKNALVIQLEERISAVKSNIEASLVQQQNALKIIGNDLMKQRSLISGKIAQVPTKEKVFRDINRKQNVKEALYQYLLQKREETQISLAITAPNAKVIDAALASSSPVSPNKRIIYLGALLLGIFVPFAILYVRYLLDTKIKSRIDVEKATTIPFIGDVPRAENGENLVEINSRTSIAEALRIVRTNLDFLLSQTTSNGAKTVFLTSTFPKEGKTFISVNLARTIAMSDKKTLLVGMDIRNPKIDDYLNVPKKGVTNFLSNKQETTILDYVVKLKGFDNFYVLPAGIIPPNPAELLMGKKVDELFAVLKQNFDFIIVDTAPVSIVTDTMLIAKHADAFIYVTRANFLDKRMLAVPQKLYNEKRLPNLSILLNDTQVDKGYGYGYGYGYGQEVVRKSLFNRIFRR